jgi:amidophosphoribosyltransferase
VAVVQARARAYAVVAQIAGYGLLAFRDPFGIRPLCLGFNESDKGIEYMMASESVALEGMGFRFVRDVARAKRLHRQRRQAVQPAVRREPDAEPCAFEYVYLARPDSVIDGASVYATRLKMGEFLAEKIRAQFKHGEIDVVMPIPDSSRPAAMELA